MVTFIREVIKGITGAEPWIFLGLLCLDLAQFHKHMTKIPVQPLQKKMFPLVCERNGGENSSADVCGRVIVLGFQR